MATTMTKQEMLNRIEDSLASMFSGQKEHTFKMFSVAVKILPLVKKAFDMEIEISCEELSVVVDNAIFRVKLDIG